MFLGKTSVGTIHLATILNRSQSIEIDSKDLGLPTNFKMGIIKVVSIETMGLSNKEWMGKQDPYVLLRLDDWEEATSTKSNGGNNVCWIESELDISIEVNEDILRSEKLVIEV